MHHPVGHLLTHAYESGYYVTEPYTKNGSQSPRVQHIFNIFLTFFLPHKQLLLSSL